MYKIVIKTCLTVWGPTASLNTSSRAVSLAEEVMRGKKKKEGSLQLHFFKSSSFLWIVLYSHFPELMPNVLETKLELEFYKLVKL
jgi:hypothetical protein